MFVGKIYHFPQPLMHQAFDLHFHTNMEDVVARLERVADRLEAVQVIKCTLIKIIRQLTFSSSILEFTNYLHHNLLQGRFDSGSVIRAPAAGPTPRAYPPAAPAPAASPSSAGGPLEAYQTLLKTDVAALVDAAEKVGGEVLRATRILAEAFHRETEIVAALASCAKPSDPSALQPLLQSTAEKMMEAGSLSSGPASPYSNHFKVVAESAQALSWVAYQPGCGLAMPPQHVDDAWGAAEFYATKVLMGFKGKGPEHAEWVNAVKKTLQGLKAYCVQYHASGPTWNPAGGALSQFKYDPKAAAATPVPTAPVVSAPAPKKKAAPPAAPPPPPPGTLIQPKTTETTDSAASSAGGGGGTMAALFAEINKGTSVTSGLRKVTDDMKTKNKPDRVGAVPATTSAAAFAPPTAAATPKTGAGAKPSGPSRLECEQGRKWVVENWTGNKELVVEDTDPKQSVYIFNCHNSTVQIKGKVNAITLDGCSKCGLLFDTVVASAEVVNCKGVQMQCTGAAPTVSIDKTDGCQLFMPVAALEGTEITTAKSSEVNVVAMGANDEEEPQEFAVPEQFVSRYRGGKVVTEAVSHNGG